MKKTIIITLEFTKLSPEVIIKVGNDALKNYLNTHNDKIYNIINIMKTLIPNNKSNSKIKLISSISIDKNGPFLKTTCKCDSTILSIFQNEINYVNNLNDSFTEAVLEVCKNV